MKDETRRIIKFLNLGSGCIVLIIRSICIKAIYLLPGSEMHNHGFPLIRPNPGNSGFSSDQ